MTNNKNMSKTIIDADYDPKQVIIQNPNKPCPEELLKTLGLMQVKYIGFDGEEHVGQIVISTKVMTEVEAFFNRAYTLRFPIERVVPVSAPEYLWDGKKVLADNVSAGFDYRKIKGTDKISLHGRGLAFDINPCQNPYIIYENGERVMGVPRKNAAWDPSNPGTLSAEHPLVKLMEGFGWEWGGRWAPESGRTDYMHFQRDL